MTAKKKSTRGGKREGAGRPLRGKEPRVLFFQTTVANSTKAAFEAASQRLGKSIGEILDQIAEKHLKGKAKR